MACLFTLILGFPARVGGLMLDMDAVSAWAKARKLWVVEDAPHAFPAAYRRSSPLAVAAVRAEDVGRVLFFFLRQQDDHDGRGAVAVTGRFLRWKLRTMTAGDGPEVTAAGDSRVTRVGRVLRRLELDELTQLLNVLKGEMSFVGPRPEVLALVDLTSETWKRVLAVRPGITDPVSLKLRDEESLLVAFEGDREAFYREVLQPFKLEGYDVYLRQRTVWSDLHVLLGTVLVASGVLRRPPPR